MAKNTKAYMALMSVCIIWGTTYMAIRVGALHYPPFLFAGVRQAVAGIILISIGLMINKKKDLSRKNIFQQMLIGFLMLTIGNGFVTYGEKNVSSGIAALICSMMPMFAVLFGLISSKKEHFNTSIGIGMLLGIFGVGMIFKENILDFSHPGYLIGMLSILLATSMWALGSITNKKSATPVNPMFNSGLQLLFGGIFLLGGSSVVEDYKGLQLWQPHALLALVYLIIFGSVLAYTAYMYALSKLPVGIATLYAYVNPLVAVLVGYWILGEPLTIYTAFAFITIVLGVYMVNKGYRKQHKKALALNNDPTKVLSTAPEVN